MTAHLNEELLADLPRIFFESSSLVVFALDFEFVVQDVGFGATAKLGEAKYFDMETAFETGEGTGAQAASA